MRKKKILEILHDYGVTCSYHEYDLFKTSAAASATPRRNSLGIFNCDGGLIQAVADNFDATIHSQNGLQSTHALALMMTQTGSISANEGQESRIKRLKRHEVHIKVLERGFKFKSFGNIDASTKDALKEASNFVNQLYTGEKPSTDVEQTADLSKLRYKIWLNKIGRRGVISAPSLKSLPPSNQAFGENAKRALLQSIIWKSAPKGDPPLVDPIDYGWSKDVPNKSLKAITMAHGTPFAPTKILEMMACGCAADQPCA